MVVTFVTSGTPSHLYCAIESLSAFQKKKKRKQALPSTVFHMTTLKKRIRNVSLREQIKTCRQTRLHIKVRKGGGEEHNSFELHIYSNRGSRRRTASLQRAQRGNITKNKTENPTCSLYLCALYSWRRH